jgi:hypothetical protein
MRKLLGCLAIILGAGSVALAARYGFKGSDTLVDGGISAAVFGAIALCAFLLHGVAVRLGLEGHRLGAAVIGLIAVAALFVTFTNSLGAIASRGDSTLAERAKAVDTRKDDRTELARIAAERQRLPTFTPATAETVAAAKRAADTATKNREAECGKRGPNCRQREIDEQAAADKLVTATTNKAATERAAKLDADAVAIRKRLDAAPAVTNPHPLGAALEAMLGAGAAALTAWQQAIVAAVFELCLVAVMVAFELLGHGQGRPAGSPAPAEASRRLETPVSVVGAAEGTPAAAVLPAPRKPRAKAPGASQAGSVKGFFRDYIFPAEDGERVDIKTMVDTYRGWCAGKGLTPVNLDAFLDEVERLCGKLGVTIEPGEDQRVYAVGVKIEAPVAVRVT